MVHPIYYPAAFMGGRSCAEIADCDSPKAMDSSIAIGIGALLSAIIIYFGQALFWRSIPLTALYASYLAAVLAVVYALFYRLLIRSSEVAHWLGKCLLLTFGFCLTGVNALLAGHELVLLPFASQVEDMTVLMANHNVGDLRDQTEKALGLSGLRQDITEARADAGDARDRLHTTPIDVVTLQQQANTCDQQNQRMQAALPDATAEHYASAYALWQKQRSRCATLHQSAQQALAQHRTQAQADLDAADQRQKAAATKLARAKQDSDEAVNAAAPTLTLSATTGFGRHKALWAAVDSGKVPAVMAYGLMLAALVFEAAGMLLKLVLPKDERTYSRVVDAQITATMGESELAYAKAYTQQIKPVVHAQTQQIQADAQRLAETVLAPSMNTRMAADQFARAARATRSAQQRSNQAATPVIDELSKVLPGGFVGGRAAMGSV